MQALVESDIRESRNASDAELAQLSLPHDFLLTEWRTSTRSRGATRASPRAGTS